MCPPLRLIIDCVVIKLMEGIWAVSDSEQATYPLVIRPELCEGLPLFVAGVEWGLRYFFPFLSIFLNSSTVSSASFRMLFSSLGCSILPEW